LSGQQISGRWPIFRYLTAVDGRFGDYLVIDPSDFTRSDLRGAEEFQPDRIVSVGIHESELPNRAAHPKSLIPAEQWLEHYRFLHGYPSGNI
jgi:hypothetical protein